MLTKSNSLGGISGIAGGGGDAPYSMMMGGGFASVFGENSGGLAAIPSSSSGILSTNTNLNRNMLDLDMDGLLLTGTIPSQHQQDSTFNPESGGMKDMEVLRRRARNNSILAKIQELEANASVQAARSERLRMMRDEYESLVRKYSTLSSSRHRKWSLGGGSGSNGYLNENNNVGYLQGSYLPSRYNSNINSSQQQPFIFASGSTSHPQLLTNAVGENGHFSSPLLHDGPGGNPNNSSFTTETGVNTDITGPVRPASNNVEIPHEPRMDCLFPGERKKVKVVLDIGCQTEKVPSAMISPSVPPGELFISGGKMGTGANQVRDGIQGETDIAEDKQEKRLPVPMELETIMMEEEDDESLMMAQQQGKLQMGRLLQLKEEPKGNYPIGRKVSNNQTKSEEVEKEVFKIQQSQSLKQNDSRNQKKDLKSLYEELDDEESEKKKALIKLQKIRRGSEESEGESDTLHMPFHTSNSVVLARRQIEIADLSLSDSTSVRFNEKHQKERKELMKELEAIAKKQKTTREENDESSDADETEEKTVDRTTTAGATSESLAENSASFLAMDSSLQKTPDTLPKDDSELVGIVEEANEEKEIEFDKDDDVEKVYFAGGAPPNKSNNDGSKAEKEGIKSTGYYADGNADELLHYKNSGGGEDGRGGNIKELVAHRYHPEDDDDDDEEDEINEAEEIRSNNLSSSSRNPNTKLDVLVEEEQQQGFISATHANNPNEKENEDTNAVYFPYSSEANIKTIPSAFFYNFGETGNEKRVRHDDDKEQGNATKVVEGKAKGQLKGNDMSTEENVSGGTKNGNDITLPEAKTIEDAAANAIYSHSANMSNPIGIDEKEEEAQFPTRQLSTASSVSSSESTSSRQQSFENEQENKIESEQNFPKTKGQPQNKSKAGEKGKSSSPGATSSNNNNRGKVANNSFRKATRNPPNGSSNLNGINEGGKASTTSSTTSNGKTLKSTTSSSSSPQVKPGQGGVGQQQPQHVTVPSGITGANNTAKRFRLKFNYDDSESDSSEISPAGAAKTAGSAVSSTNVAGVNAQGGVGVSSSGGVEQQQNTGNNSQEKQSGEERKQEKDDFDDFFDI